MQTWGTIASVAAATLAVILMVTVAVARAEVRRARHAEREAKARAQASAEESSRLREDLAANEVRREAVHASEERLRTLVRNAPVTLFTVDRGAIVTAIEGQGLLGPHPTDAIGWPVNDLFPREPGVVRAVTEALAGTASNGRATVAERTFAMHYAPLRESGGTIIGATGMALDVTEQAETEQALDEQSLLAQALVDAQSDLGDLVVVTEAGSTTYVNDAASAITGYDQGELLALSSFFALALDRDRAELERLRGDRVAGQVIRFEVTIRRKDSALVDLEMAEAEVQAGARLRTIAIGRDVTDRRRVERERQSLVARLLAAEEETRHRIALDLHDDTIQALYAALLRLQGVSATVTEPAALEALQRLSATIDHAITGLRHLVFDLHPTVLDMDGLAPAIRVTLEEMARTTGLTFEVVDRCDEEIDAQSRIILYRIAHEALANIRKHARASRVDVLIEDRDAGVQLVIHDDGRGFTVDDARSPEPGHLGLQALRERAETVHGRFEVHSRPGAGTTVDVWIPRAGVECAA